MNSPPVSIVVIFEDLHWIDSETQGLLDVLADSIANARILLLVSYRPEYRHEWSNKSHYSQIRLDALGRESAREMLTELLGETIALGPLKQLIIERSEGNPFFIEEIVQSLFEEGALVRNGTVRLTRPLEALKVPATVKAIIAARIDLLSEDRKDLLQALATIGQEFSLSLVRSVMGKSDDDLGQMINDLRIGEFVYEQPAVGDAKYIFKHALTQQVAYDSILIEQRKALHERIGATIETLFPDRLDDHLTDLAHHYRLSRNIRKALEYLQRAGQNEARRSACTAAIDYFRAALKLLETLPQSGEGQEHELALQLALGPSLYAAKGPGDPEVELVYNRARELSEQIGDTSSLFSALYGLQSMYCFRSEWKMAEELARASLNLAEETGDSGMLIEGHHNLTWTEGWRGELLKCVSGAEKVKSLYDRTVHGSHSLKYGHDPLVCCTGLKALALWTLGYPQQALRSIDEAECLAHDLGHAFNETLTALNATWVQGACGFFEESSTRTQALRKLCEEHGFGAPVGWALVFSGSNLAKQGQAERAIYEIEAGDADLRARKTEMGGAIQALAYSRCV